MARLRTVDEIFREQGSQRGVLTKTAGEIFFGSNPERRTTLTTPESCEPDDNDSLEELQRKEEFAGQQARDFQSRTPQTRAASAAISLDHSKWDAVWKKLGVAVFDAQQRLRGDRVPVAKALHSRGYAETKKDHATLLKSAASPAFRELPKPTQERIRHAIMVCEVEFPELSRR